ncbi:MAG: L-aspartate oxidase [Elusimicrobia bacterium GWF2_52_66]|nr:MAG: L-aspartate oxidase [Elusimicrobia bacterium GWA2_51_34]OGR88202.1 MAG: L-aspartate oxidase [Elusimicrobia bacterium GWF2_52_66]HAF95407.1 L-aspartate oxidase [Elusimicrobiota bacterium]HCE98729.1 L-aspartate oxidase [Elusimicrobiota bacterium]
MSIYKSDFLVIGSGVSGLLCAHKLSALGSVSILSKREAFRSNTDLAQGGIAAVMDETNDAFFLHVKDTLNTGAGLSDRRVVEFTVREAPERIRELVELGVRFAGAPGHFELGLEGGHSRRRILHAADATGHEVERALLETCRARANIRFFENHSAVDLILAAHPSSVKPRSNACLGAYALEERSGRVHSFLAGRTVLASGGAGKVYRYTSNPDVSTGDGMAMSYRAGLDLVNLEFVQFHPTCLYFPGAKSFLISEALRGEGGVLRLAPGGAAFMKKYSPLKDLAPRDVVARAIDSELKRTGQNCVYLDITHLPPAFIKHRFPTIRRRCLEFGLDIAKNPIPVVPAAHFFCGGVAVNEYSKTALSGLYAVGEVSHTGLHGANRLASNSLLEGCVFAHRAYLSIKKDFLNRSVRAAAKARLWNCGNARHSDEAVIIAHNWDEVRTLMWNYVGIVRSDKRLERASARMDIITGEIIKYYWDFLPTRDLLELRNIACLAAQIIRSARIRKESRGLHFNINYPRLKAAWLKPTRVNRYQGKVASD